MSAALAEELFDLELIISESTTTQQSFRKEEQKLLITVRRGRRIIQVAHAAQRYGLLCCGCAVVGCGWAGVLLLSSHSAARFLASCR